MSRGDGNLLSESGVTQKILTQVELVTAREQKKKEKKKGQTQSATETSESKIIMKPPSLRKILFAHKQSQSSGRKTQRHTHSVQTRSCR